MLSTILAVACKTNDPSEDGITGATQPTEPSQPTGDVNGKMIVVYFSRAGENWQVGTVDKGNTAVMAGYISELADIDTFEIQPETIYPVGYNDMLAVATSEFDNNTRPVMKNDISNLKDYATVFIGGPIWWSRPPMIIRTFLEAHPELAEKTIVPFGTHGGSGISSYNSLIKEYFPDATILESLGISGAQIREETSKTQVSSWLQRLGVLSTNN